MEVEVSEIFAPAAGKRPANFVVLKYFLLGMMFSNAIESILIVPKTLSLMEENQEQLEHLASLMEEHDAFKQELHELSLVNKKVLESEKKNFNSMTHEGDDEGEESSTHLQTAVGHPTAKKKKSHNKITFEASEEPMGGKANEKMIEYLLMIYGIVTMAIGIFAVYRENDKLLMLFIGTTALGLIVLFFSGLTLIVFMAILNDIIIALISFKYLQLMTQAVPADYMNGGPIPTSGMAGAAFPEPAYNVNAYGQPGATYVVNQW